MERIVEICKHFASTILVFRNRFAFSFSSLFSSSSQKSSPLSKFERTFEEIKKRRKIERKH